MNTEKPKVLVVDDIPANLSLLLDYLEEMGFQVLVAESGQSALNRIQYITPDIILLDIAMLGMDGFETCRRLKAIPHLKEIPILFLTARTETVDKVRGFDVGGADYLTKPIDKAEIQARLNTHLKLYWLQQHLHDQNKELEVKVQNRTVELRAEIERRKYSEAEKERMLAQTQHLLELVRHQSEQLRIWTQGLVDSQQVQRNNLVQTLKEQIDPKLTLLYSFLDSVRTLSAHNAPVENQILTYVNNSLDVLTQLTEDINELTAHLTQTNTQSLENSPLLALSPREHEVLQLIAEGKSNHEIADMLNITAGTTRTYRSRIMHKLKARNTADLVRIALRYNLDKSH